MGMAAYEPGRVYAIPVQDEYVVTPPIWEEYYPVARNWLARIEERPKSPRGLTRRFCERGRGRFLYCIEKILAGPTLEFGADRLRGDDRTRVRWYGEVVGVTATELQVRYFKTAEDMFATIQDRESRLQEAPST